MDVQRKNRVARTNNDLLRFRNIKSACFYRPLFAGACTPILEDAQPARGNDDPASRE